MPELQQRTDVNPEPSDWHRPFVFDSVPRKKFFVLGLGGGCDILTAYALTQLLNHGDRELVYANTKTSNIDGGEHLSANIVRITSSPIDPSRRVRGRGRLWIDRSVPRHANDSPWIVLLRDSDAERNLVDEICDLGFDLLIGVDTGGDSIARKAGRGASGRDQRMLRVLRETGLPVLHVVVAPGSDGESAYQDLHTVFEEHRNAGLYRGRFALEQIAPFF